MTALTPPTPNPINGAVVRQIGTKHVVTCWRCDSLYFSTKSAPQAEAERDKHNRRHTRRP